MTAEIYSSPDTENVLDVYSARQRLLLVLAVIASVVVCVAGSVLLHVPPGKDFSASLLHQPHASIAVVAVVGMYLMSIVIASLIARTVHTEAGLFCAAAGLASVSARGGAMRFALFHAGGHRTAFATFILELVILALLTAVGWLLVLRVSGMGRAVPVDHVQQPQPLTQKLMSLAMQVILMSILLVLLVQSDSKAQALASVGLAAFIATTGAQWFAPTSPASWMLAGPFIVGLIGYLMAYANTGDLDIGRLRGGFAPLARALPLDYASLGVAGALMGYWNTRKWRPWTTEKSKSNS